MKSKAEATNADSQDGKPTDLDGLLGQGPLLLFLPLPVLRVVPTFNLNPCV